MKIELHLPRPLEARVSYDDKLRQADIEPRFLAARARHMVAHVLVAGDTGRARRYVLEVHSGTGRLFCTEAPEVRPAFDLDDAAGLTADDAVNDSGDGRDGRDSTRVE